MKKSRMLALDIETSPILAYVWGLRDQFITPGQISKDWYILAYGAKWVGEKKVFYEDARNRRHGDDRALLGSLWKLMNEADIILTQNGEQFDAKKINARFMLNGFKPPKPYLHYDTLKLVRKVAGFSSNRLEYLTDKFCVKHKKTSHKKYPGLVLWLECLKGNKDAWNELKKYNIKDVLSTEELYTKIKAWAPESMPKLFELTDAEKECGTCGYVGAMVLGKPRRTKKYKYQQNSCPKCGSWQKGEKIQ